MLNRKFQEAIEVEAKGFEVTDRINFWRPTSTSTASGTETLRQTSIMWGSNLWAWIVTNDVLTSPEVDVLKSAEVDSLMLVEVGKNTRCVGRRSASFPSEEWTSASPL
ncbi:uncharacterized protein LOC110989103 isoform X2 [Acanthaster planci]|uniref:Uncharacterized protein LOC110989103 isoform X2 n=1 Tax=Acanthaster planci TaxID=133434 RepID=A0A8B7ZU24_ACAPL|nr:uncharacterized protein LOC110989103 isoform X2 [Acanthaster planci]